MIKTFVYLDGTTINPDLCNRIISRNTDLKPVERNLYILEFQDSVFSHALLLMGQNKNRFGYDLSLYINTAILIFSNLNTTPFILLMSGSSDFKRRASEDLGVSVSSLFMVQSLGLCWETIAQIPQNRKLSKYTPDFLGFDQSENRFIFESKGTTQAEKIEATMNKALSQAKSYPEDATNKMSIVSFFPSGAKTFPSYTFVADPPTAIGGIFPPDRSHAVMLHFTKVLQFAGFESTLGVYEQLLAAKFKSDLGEEIQRLPGFNVDEDVARLRDQTVEVFRNELQTRSQFEWRDHTFYGRAVSVDIGETPRNLFMGVSLDVLTSIIKLETDIPTFANTSTESSEELISTFSDGTIFRLSSS